MIIINIVFLVITFGQFWEGTNDATIRLISRKTDSVAEMEIS